MLKLKVNEIAKKRLQRRDSLLVLSRVELISLGRTDLKKYSYWFRITLFNNNLPATVLLLPAC